jgi:hypothetical protein
MSVTEKCRRRDVERAKVTPDYESRHPAEVLAAAVLAGDRLAAVPTGDRRAAGKPAD